MNENQTKTQNIDEQQVFSNNNVENGNLMDNFSQTVVSEMQPEIQQKTQSEQVSSTSNEIYSSSSKVTSNEGTMNQNDILEEQSNQSAPTEVGQVAQKPTQIHNKEKSHWTFIIALFAIVGVFVVFLPLLVKLFGY